MNNYNFSINNEWDNQENKILFEKKSGQKFIYISKNDMKMTALGLSVATPVIHLALSVVNIVVKSFLIISFYHFWKSEAESSSFKAKLLNVGKDALAITLQPVTYLALEISALIALLRPYDGMKLYYNIELAAYDRSLMLQFFNIGTIEDEVVDTKPVADVQNSQNPINPVIPPIEQMMDQMIEEFKQSARPFQLHFRDKFVDLLANLILENNHPLNDINDYIEMFKGKTENLLRPQYIPTKKDVACAAIKIGMNNNSFKALQALVVDEEFKNELFNVINAVEIPQINPDQPESIDRFIERYKIFLNIRGILPVEDHSMIDPKPFQHAIKEAYIGYFDVVLRALHETNELYEFDSIEIEDENGGNEMPDINDLLHTIKIMNNLLALLDAPQIEGLKNSIFHHPLKKHALEKLASSKNYPTYAAIAKASLYIIELNDNHDLGISDFVKQIENTSELLGDVSSHSKDLYYDFFLMCLKNQIACSAMKIKKMLDMTNFDFSNDDQSKMAQRFQNAIRFLQNDLKMDLELKVDMFTDYDILTARLVSLLNTNNNVSIRNWIDSIQNNANYNLAGFTAWLPRVQIPQHVLNQMTSPEDIYAYYVGMQG